MVYLLPELYTQCVNLVPFGVADCRPDGFADPYVGFFFWFGCGLNFLWIVVPVCLIAANIRASAVSK